MMKEGRAIAARQKDAVAALGVAGCAFAWATYSALAVFSFGRLVYTNPTREVGVFLLGLVTLWRLTLREEPIHDVHGYRYVSRDAPIVPDRRSHPDAPE